MIVVYLSMIMVDTMVMSFKYNVNNEDHDDDADDKDNDNDDCKLIQHRARDLVRPSPRPALLAFLQCPN
jgi:hypothetical protein